jgi:hypothetical protein
MGVKKYSQALLPVLNAEIAILQIALLLVRIPTMKPQLTL